MKFTKKAVCAVLALIVAASCMAACVRSTPKQEPEEESHTVITTREYVYKGTSIDDFDSNTQAQEFLETTTEKTAHNKKHDKTNPIKKIIEKLPEAIRPEIKDEEKKHTVKIDIPVGLTMVQSFAYIESKGISTFSDLMNAAQNVDFTFYPLIKAQKNTGRAYALEGYLCSGEYEFEKNAKPEDIIGAMLRRTESKITTQHRRQIAKQGKTIDDIIIIASIIEKESVSTKEMKKLSAVINNRLASNMKLEMKSCIMYVDSDIKPYAPSEDSESLKKYNEYYNTLVCPALPAGPICTPSSAAIDAALNPEGDYKYFCVDAEGNYYFTQTQKEHEAQLVKLGYMEAVEEESQTNVSTDYDLPTQAAKEEIS